MLRDPEKCGRQAEKTPEDEGDLREAERVEGEHPDGEAVTEAASAANNQSSSTWPGARDARKSLRTALTISQTHAPKPTKPTSRALFSH
jgi:hypothetical protein